MSNLAVSTMLLALLFAQAPSSGAPDRAPAKPPNAEPQNVISGFTVYAPSTAIDGLEVVDRKRCKTPGHTNLSVDPRVVSTYPDYDSIVPSGPLLVRVTYDQAMSPCSFSILVSVGRENMELVETPALMSADRRSFLFLWKLAPGADFQLSFNALGGLGAPTLNEFRSGSGGYGVPHVLVFRSSIQKRSASPTEAARLDPAFDEINFMPGKLASLGVPRWHIEPFSKH